MYMQFPANINNNLNVKLFIQNEAGFLLTNVARWT